MSPPSAGFSETDLVGTWYAGRSWRSDTLVLREDGTYKQIIRIDHNREDSSFDYESNWQPWRLSYGANGIPYLHLEGMRLCAYGGGYISCEVIGGGEALWYDACQKTWIDMPGKGVLTVRGVHLDLIQPPRGILLDLLQRSEDVWGYRLHETAVPAMTPQSLP